MVCTPTTATEGGFSNYMYGHGFGTMFLASAYGEEEDKDQREKLEKSIKKAVEFICKAQTNRKHRKPEGKEVEIGGWGYVERHRRQQLRRGLGDDHAVTGPAGRPQRRHPRAQGESSTRPPTTSRPAPRRGAASSTATPTGAAALSNGQERPPLTAAAVACSFSAGQYKGELAKKWIKYCKETIPIAKGRVAHDEYQSYYFAQVMYVLGEDRYGDLFPKEDKSTWITWSKYKEAMFPYILDQQSQTEGNWTGSGGYGIGPVFVTAVNLSILQLDRGTLPIFQR